MIKLLSHLLPVPLTIQLLEFSMLKTIPPCNCSDAQLAFYNGLTVTTREYTPQMAHHIAPTKTWIDKSYFNGTQRVGYITYSTNWSHLGGRIISIDVDEKLRRNKIAT